MRSGKGRSGGWRGGAGGGELLFQRVGDGKAVVVGCHGWSGALRQSKKSPASAARAFKYARIRTKSTFAAGNAASAVCRHSLVRCWRRQVRSPTSRYVVTFPCVRSPPSCVRNRRAYVRSLWVPQGDRKGSVAGHALGTGRWPICGELLERIRDIRSSEKVFWRKVLGMCATSAD